MYEIYRHNSGSSFTVVFALDRDSVLLSEDWERITSVDNLQTAWEIVNQEINPVTLNIED